MAMGISSVRWRWANRLADFLDGLDDEDGIVQAVKGKTIARFIIYGIDGEWVQV